MRYAILLSFGVAVLGAASNLAGDNIAKDASKPANPPGGLGEYLTKDGKLMEAVTFRKDSVGLVTPERFGKEEVWVIEPAGDWTNQSSASSTWVRWFGNCRLQTCLPASQAFQLRSVTILGRGALRSKVRPSN